MVRSGKTNFRYPNVRDYRFGQDPAQAWRELWTATHHDPAVHDILTHPCAFAVMARLIMGEFRGADSLFERGRGFVDPDEVLALSLSEPGVAMIPRLRLTQWCFAHGATGKQAFHIACTKRNFWLARWLVKHGATPSHWSPAPVLRGEPATVPDYRLRQQAKLVRVVEPALRMTAS